MKQHEKKFQDSEKDKTWNINQCKKEKLNKKRKQRKRIFFDGKEKTEKESFAAVSKKDSYLFGTVFYINIKRIQRQKRSLK